MHPVVRRPATHGRLAAWMADGQHWPRVESLECLATEHTSSSSLHCARDWPQPVAQHTLDVASTTPVHCAVVLGSPVSSESSTAVELRERCIVSVRDHHHSPAVSVRLCGHFACIQ